MNENPKSTADAVVNVAVGEANVAAIIALAAVAAEAAPVATSNARCRIMFKTAELDCNRNGNWKGRLMFNFFLIISQGVGSIKKGTYTVAIANTCVATTADTVADVGMKI